MTAPMLIPGRGRGGRCRDMKRLQHTVDYASQAYLHRGSDDDQPGDEQLARQLAGAFQRLNKTGDILSTATPVSDTQ